VCRQISRSFADLAGLLDGNIRGDSDLAAREAAALREFPMYPAQGLSRAQASAAFKKHGLNPRGIGTWIQYGYLDHADDQRWLTAKGRERAELAG
jgi:hypothetical protein